MSTSNHSATIAPEPPPDLPPEPYAPPGPEIPPETTPGAPVSDPPLSPDPGGPITAIPTFVQGIAGRWS